MGLKLGTTDISGVPTTLINTVNNKLDASTYTSNPRTNAVYITQTYHSGASWYRVWSDGFIEQGGITNAPSAVNDSYTISLIKNMTSTNYVVIVHRNSSSAVTSTSTANARGIARYMGMVISKSTSSFTMQSEADNYSWFVAGY